MVNIRSEEELTLMKESGRITARALKKVLQNIAAGKKALEIDKIAEREIKRLGGEPSFKTIKDYKWTTCITFNEQVVHGIPTGRELKEGDIVSIDLGTVYRGWHTDSAWSILVKTQNSKLKSQNYEEKERFLKVGREALKLGIKEAKAGNRVGNIGAAIQKKVEGEDYHVVRSLVGHGVGRSLHEEPEIPGYGTSGTGPILKTGMTLAIEVIYAEGTPDVVLEKDGWTYSTADGSLAGLFEMSVIVGKKQAKVLTDWRKV